MVVLAGIALPQLLGSLDRARGLMAARYLGGRLALARTQAVSRRAAIALRFEQRPRGIVFTTYQDGNRNGIRAADIARGVDRPLDPPLLLGDQFPGAAIGVVPGFTESDPVQLGRTDILTFSPLGTATSGTIYIRGRDGTQWAVRVLGATGRTRVLRYVARTREWTDAY